MEDFEKRMVVEYKQLEERRDKLNAFLNYDDNAEKREGICEGELGEMHKQLEAMDRYIEALGARLQIRGICYNGFTDEELAEFGYVKSLKCSNAVSREADSHPENWQKTIQLTKSMAMNLLNGTYPNFDVRDKIPREIGEEEEEHLLTREEIRNKLAKIEVGKENVGPIKYFTIVTPTYVYRNVYAAPCVNYVDGTRNYNSSDLVDKIFRFGEKNGGVVDVY